MAPFISLREVFGIESRLQWAWLFGCELLLLPFRFLAAPHWNLRLLLQWKRMAEDFDARDQKIDLFRITEYLFAAERLRQWRPARWFDGGSGDTPFVAHVLGRSGIAHTTINDPDLGCLDAQKKMLDAAGVAPERYLLSQHNYAEDDDGQPAPGAIDALTFVSSIEHVPGGGDIELMRRLAASVRPGGRVLVTVPSWLEYHETTDTSYYHGLFERRYNAKALRERLLPEGFEIEEELFLCEARTPLARLLARRHGDLGTFFARWYEKRPSYLYNNWTTLWLNLLLLSAKRSEDPSQLAILAVFRRKSLPQMNTDFHG